MLCGESDGEKFCGFVLVLRRKRRKKGTPFSDRLRKDIYVYETHVEGHHEREKNNGKTYVLPCSFTNRTSKCIADFFYYISAKATADHCSKKPNKTIYFLT